MKNIPLYALLFILSCIIGSVIGYQGFFVHIPIPSGKWEKISDISKASFDVDINRLKILTVTERTSTAYIFEQGFSYDTLFIWKCNIKTNECSKTDQSLFPLNPETISLTHEVKLSEVPPIPSPNHQFVDLIKIVHHVSDDISYEYYVILNDGTIWRWGYYSAMYSFSLVTRYLLSTVGGMIGLVLAIMVIILNTKLSRRLVKSETET